jgi:hypothetical protein
MRIGSWHNPDDREAIERDLLVVGAVSIVALGLAASVLGDGLGGAAVFLVLVALCGCTAFAFSRWPGLAGSGTSGVADPHVHPGISAHRIPVAGVPGFLFAALMVEMFWFGVPGYRPLVVAVVVLGALLGAALIVTRRR